MFNMETRQFSCRPPFQLRRLGTKLPLSSTLIPSETESSKKKGDIIPKNQRIFVLLAVAARVVVAHNHPSGDSTPSPQDVALTKRLSKAGREIGLEVLDHIVLGDEGQYTSLRDIGIMAND